MMMWGGYHYIVSAGNPQKMNQGKEIISGAIIGLVLALTSFLLLQTINPALVNFRGILPIYIGQILVREEREATPLKKDVATKADVSTSTLKSILSLVKQNSYDRMVLSEANNDKEVAYRALSILFIESSGVANAKSIANAYGLMQLLPATAETCGVAVNDLFDPAKNIKAGVCYLKSLLSNPCPTPEQMKKRNVVCRVGEVCKKSEIKFVYAAYNGGSAANFCSSTCLGQTWWQCTENPGYEETRVYAQKAQLVYDWLWEQKVY
ncbi:MAG: lytic transglycosylase domain-containing protein [Candidatus Kerfeldbacteria bacterium]|nr:lytic transglycosylase domain-containing protein [Candidatus Kerfeldbacteria bacterium]